MPSNAEYEVIVHFTPRGVSPSNASETRAVSFILDGGYTPRDRVYELAREEAVEQGVISHYGVYNHWDPFTVEVVTPEHERDLIGPAEF